MNFTNFFMIIRCKLCSDILEEPEHPYFQWCNCKTVGVDWDKYGLARHRIINPQNAEQFKDGTWQDL